MQKRIWELDAFRGFCILAMVGVHLVYDLPQLFPFADSDWFLALQYWGGYVFIVLCGISATLGSRPVRRGLLVLLCGMACTAVTVGIYHLGLAGKSICIWFGVLHCLGSCMLLWAIWRRASTFLLLLGGITAIVLGSVFTALQVPCPWLVPLGITCPGFSSADYFPLFPNFGVFLLGCTAGRMLYRSKLSLLPQVQIRGALRFLCMCGQNSLWIYLLHQPVIALITMLFS